MQIKDVLVALAVPAICIAAAIPTPQDPVEPEFPADGQEEIVGGTAAAAGEFPFIVSLQKSGSHFCGGSLLNANTVVTAAHCAVGQTASSISVRAGSLSRTSGGTLVKVSSIKVNPSYTASTYDGDVAIFKLATAIPTSSTISYATLPASGSDPAAGSVATVAGWGTLSSGGSSLPTNLQKVDVPIVSRTTCRSNYGQSAITTNMICAGLTAGGKDSCQGDSGGPIVNTSKQLIGLVSWGEGCAAAGKPGVYTRVATVLSFINANL
ncbi:trypsin-like protease-like protein 1 [Plenodomus tracheiphilus IPT5]|uniref:Trypsin-like protease-like protein 1 n=1 Tax=Plenodomus tracheiphilus IPT5 TaxID=1408161 RepID=A0A6A7AZE8_9PLEO|nr:trypsin-like protease-like protein 1 [Plenodomus tracheiphilus IPT5]